MKKISDDLYINQQVEKLRRAISEPNFKGNLNLIKPEKYDKRFIIRLVSKIFPESNQSIIAWSNRKRFSHINTTKLINIPYDSELSQNEKLLLQKTLSESTSNSKLLIMGQQPFYEQFGHKELASCLISIGRLRSVKTIELWGCNLALDKDIKYGINFQGSFAFCFAKELTRMSKQASQVLVNTIIIAYLTGVHASRSGKNYPLDIPGKTFKDYPHLKIKWQIDPFYNHPVPMRDFAEQGFLWGDKAHLGRLRDLLPEDDLELLDIIPESGGINMHSMYAKSKY
jgi:hypothetical protein